MLYHHLMNALGNYSPKGSHIGHLSNSPSTEILVAFLVLIKFAYILLYVIFHKVKLGQT